MVSFTNLNNILCLSASILQNRRTFVKLVFFCVFSVSSGVMLGLLLAGCLQIFPGVVVSKIVGPEHSAKSLPAGVESFFVESSNGHKVELWRLAVDSEKAKPYVGLIFHGNEGTLPRYFAIQRWFQELGITSYSFDYRGYGRSSGWPTEKGIYDDSESVWGYIARREGMKPSQMIVMGYSLGGAPAAGIARRYQPKLLILISAFTSIPDLVKERYPVLSLFTPTSLFAFPTIEDVGGLTDTSLVILHGVNDGVIPPDHSRQLEQAYRGSGTVKRLLSQADHINVFHKGMKELSLALGEVIAN